MGNKSRIFICCGQRRGFDEEKIANELKAKLEEPGYNYEAYVAINDQTTKGFKENILGRLEASEYFIFIDFRREQLTNPEICEYRGSLFANQELAIAVAQEKQIIAFQESGIKEIDGIISVAQINPIKFFSRERIVDMVIDKVKSKMDAREWDSTSRDEIDISRTEDDTKETFWGGNPDDPTTAYHIKAKNQNKFKVARNCICFIKEVQNLVTGVRLTRELVENKWMILKTPDVAIPPLMYRKFDAFFIHKKNFDKAYLGYNRNIIDYPAIDFDYQLKAPGHYLITYMIYSANFRPACAIFELILPDKYEDIMFRKSQ